MRTKSGWNQSKQEKSEGWIWPGRRSQDEEKLIEDRKTQRAKSLALAKKIVKRNKPEYQRIWDTALARGSTEEP